MVHFRESDKMIKISGNVDKSNTRGLIAIFCSLLTEKLHQTEHFLRFFFFFFSL